MTPQVPAEHDDGAAGVEEVTRVRLRGGDRAMPAAAAMARRYETDIQGAGWGERAGCGARRAGQGWKSGLGCGQSGPSTVG